jgi:acyl phosphate:glycerol-3-phosphate acyltransferase
MVDVILVVAGYFIGSIPFAFIAGKIVKGIDIRNAGDGNVGAANAYRQIGPWAGIMVMVADVGKGTAAIFLARAFSPHIMTIYLTGFAAVAGHAWPVFLGFKGGRGEATASGVLVVLLPQAMLTLFGIALIPFFFTRNTMLLGAILFLPLWLAALLMGESIYMVIYSAALPALVGLNHFLTTRHLGQEARNNGKYMR